MFAPGIYTGMRLGDVVSLKWSEIDLDNGIIEHMPKKHRRRLGEIPHSSRADYRDRIYFRHAQILFRMFDLLDQLHQGCHPHAAADA